MYSKMAKACRK